MRLKETHCRSFLRFAVNLDNEIRLNKFASGLICSVYDKSVFNAVEKTRVRARFFRSVDTLRLYGSVVKRLRHRPFTAVTRVRVPSESF